MGEGLEGDSKSKSSVLSASSTVLSREEIIEGHAPTDRATRRGRSHSSSLLAAKLQSPRLFAFEMVQPLTRLALVPPEPAKESRSENPHPPVLRISSSKNFETSSELNLTYTFLPPFPLFSSSYASPTTGALQLPSQIFHSRRILAQETISRRTSSGTYLWSRRSRGRRRRLDGCHRAQDSAGEGGG